MKRPSGYFPYFLGFVFVLFTGILVYTWYGARQANPVILDEHGRPRGAAAQAR